MSGVRRVHVLPSFDLIAHEKTVDCVCGPDVEGALVVHYSLDGRETDDAFRERLEASMERNAEVLDRLRRGRP